MREIKFRAWNKKLCKMNSVEAIDFDNEEVEVDEWDSQVLFVDAILMQYTGMVDKNGKEIYEGDIVEAWSEGKRAIGEIKARIDGLWLIYPAWQNRMTWSLAPNEDGKTTVLIVGNIYENPELLRSENVGS